ncbi:MAG: RNA-binding protein [Gammaproteobacteria bacterium]|nr:RNA-binding protein [Gammaproteobacteria bacterium]MBU1655493.1 RNA-binding protein [Gammaproteobacteria bacterium]MBU1961694.1 RNA-binding protein [Gammaproteobacteria bacterium]
MEILFSHIPSDTTPDDLYHFVQKEVRHWWLPFGKPLILGCEILEVYDEESREYEYHGVVRFDDPVAAERAIRRLNGKIFNAQYVRAREFSRRSPGDRRFIDEDPFPTPMDERRKPLDRRRPALQIKRRRIAPDETY